MKNEIASSIVGVAQCAGYAVSNSANGAAHFPVFGVSTGARLQSWAGNNFTNSASFQFSFTYVIV